MKLASGSGTSTSSTRRRSSPRAQEYARRRRPARLGAQAAPDRAAPHPFAVVRAAELRSWVDSGDYTAILAGDLPAPRRRRRGQGQRRREGGRRQLHRGLPAEPGRARQAGPRRRPASSAAPSSGSTSSCAAATTASSPVSSGGRRWPRRSPASGGRCRRGGSRSSGRRGDHAGAGAVLEGLQDARGRPRRPRSLGANTSLAPSTWPGWISVLPSKPISRPWRHSAQEAVGVLARRCRRRRGSPCRPRGRPAARAARPGSSGWRPGTCSAYSSLARSLVPITSTLSRSVARRSRGVEDRRRRLDHRPERRVRRGRRRLERVDQRAHGVGAVDLGDDDRGRPGRRGRGRGRRRATRCRGRCTGWSARGGRTRRCAAAAQAASRAAGLASGATASSRSKMSASHGDRLGLLQRPLVGRRHVEHRAARPERVARVMTSIPCVRRLELGVDRRRAARRARRSPGTA